MTLAEQRPGRTDEAKTFARTTTAPLTLCLYLSQPGRLLPAWAVAVSGVPVPFVLFAMSGCSARLRGSVRYHRIELAKVSLS
jgi:hypothetical protein